MPDSIDAGRAPGSGRKDRNASQEPAIAPDRWKVTETVHTSSRAIVYRASGAESGRAVIIKVLPAQYSPQYLRRMDNEAEIGRLLEGPSVIRPIGRETYQGQPALILEDFGGVSLARSLGAPLPVERLLTLAVAVTDAVVDIHHHNVVHKDLKPDNVLVHPETGEVRIADFGIASVLPGGDGAGIPRVIEGSLPYLSPEQTGRTNRALDQRSDLYSLGVTFFEMATGKLPFVASDPLEWVHCHVARVPPAPLALVPSLPPTIAEIISKLLAKEPEDRYQSARGLRHDLRRCLAQWRAEGRIDGFALGQRDIADRLQIQHKLYGRQQESGALLQAFERVVELGTPELVLVSGYSGIGKSSLVHELQRPVVARRGRFAAGKFDQFKRDIPYATIVEAFRELVLEILAEGRERQADWKAELQAALGKNAQLIIDVIPQVELLLGPQSPVPTLPPAEAQNRFRLVMRQFIGVFAKPEHPLALFLDDLQWADSASLDLVKDLVGQKQACCLCLVGAYRDNEVGPSHPLTLTLDEIGKTPARVSRIPLGPLSKEHLGAFLGDVMHAPADEARPLAELIEEKTAGNPFFTIQFLSTLHEERMVEFEDQTEKWRWDVGKIRAKGFTDNVVDLMVSKLRRLSPWTQQALQTLACLGAGADLATLGLALGRPGEEVAGGLTEAVRAGLLLRSGDSYRFLHDRVQEAVYSLIPAEERPALHLQIGWLLVSQLSEEAVRDRIFDVVNQLDQGVALVDDPEDRSTLIRLNLLAAAKARGAIAYASARTYLRQAAALLPADAWSSRYDQTFALHADLAECEYLLGDFAAADALFERLVAQARSKMDRVKVASLRIKRYTLTGQFAEGLALAIEAFGLLGLVFPQDDTAIGAAFAAEAKAITAELGRRRIADLVDAPRMTDPDAQAIVNLFTDFLACAYNSGSRVLPLGILKILNVCLRHGNTEAACVVYSASALILVSVFGDIDSAYQLSEMSLHLNRKLDDPKLKGMVLFLHGAFANFWRRPFATTPSIMWPALIACLEVGDFVYAGYNAAHAVWHALESGDSLDEVLALSGRYMPIYRSINSDINIELLHLYDHFVLCLQGHTRGPVSFDDDTFSADACLALFEKVGATAGFFMHNLFKAMACFFHQRIDEALAFAKRASELLGANLGSALEPTHHFFHSLILAAHHDQVPQAERAEIVEALRQKRGKLELWAKSCPENYRSRHLLVSAELARIEGQDLSAEHLYEEAIRAAREAGAVQNEALANELGSRFFRGRGLPGIADHYLREAKARYQRWGAHAKALQLEETHPQLRDTAPSGATTFAAGTEHLDLLSVIKASQAISGEIVLEELLHKLVEVVVAQAGATKGYVLLRREDTSADNLAIEAEALVTSPGALEVHLHLALPFEDSARLPSAIISYVRHTKETVVLDDASRAPRFGADPYLARGGPKSVLCMPIVRQGGLVGVLYLENSLVTGAFRRHELAVLELLASQAAISLEHALLLAKEKTARQEALEALRAREEFLTVASHELRTPMTSLTFALQTLAGHANPKARAPIATGQSGPLLELALRQSRRMTRLIEELLEVSRIQSGRLALELGEVDLVEVVREALGRFELDLERAGCQVSFAAEGPVMGRWDATRLGQVIENLLSNAIKFGPGRPIEVEVRAQGGVAQVRVEDHGIGIEPAQQAHIFERFGRAVSEEHYGGLGLGLYICRRILAAHGGDIRVASLPGQGAAFTIELPCLGPN